MDDKGLISRVLQRIPTVQLKKKKKDLTKTWAKDLKTFLQR